MVALAFPGLSYSALSGQLALAALFGAHMAQSLANVIVHEADGASYAPHVVLCTLKPLLAGMVAATFEAAMAASFVTVTMPVSPTMNDNAAGATLRSASGVAVTFTVTGVVAVLLPAIDTLAVSAAGAVSVI